MIPWRRLAAMRWELEELAREAHEETNLGGSVNPYTLARRLKLRVLDGGVGCEGILVGDRVIIDASLRPTRRAFVVAHEVGHFLLRRCGLADPEHLANYLGAALLLPRLDFEADLRRWGWDVLRICAKYRYASFEAAARRICALREARACVFDHPLRGQAPPSSYVVPWEPDAVPTEEEIQAAEAARQYGAPIELRAGLMAWPVLEDGWHRVITVANM